MANQEIYLCERDAGINVPNQRYVDIFCMDESICNQQLALMWKRVLYIYPRWIVQPIIFLNRFIPNGEAHEIGSNSCEDRDIYNLLDQFPPHLQFTTEEEEFGKANLRNFGLSIGAKFVCINVRDSAYLAGPDWAYHNYRDSNIDNYILTAEELADRGYFIFRMGAKVHAPIKSLHPKVIDYATNGMRSEFMDIYLGAKCEFSISTGTGWDAIPENFRKPVVFVNILPLGAIHTYRSELLTITKKHVWKKSQKEMTLKEIFDNNLGFIYSSSEYESKGVEIIENTSEEILEIAMEMIDRIEGAWQMHPVDEKLQKYFKNIFQVYVKKQSKDKPLHGEIRSYFGAKFLRKNLDWLN